MAREPIWNRPAPPGGARRARDLARAKRRAGAAAVAACSRRYGGPPSLVRNANRARCIRAAARDHR